MGHTREGEDTGEWRSSAAAVAALAGYTTITGANNTSYTETTNNTWGHSEQFYSNHGRHADFKHCWGNKQCRCRCGGNNTKLWGKIMEQRYYGGTSTNKLCGAPVAILSRGISLSSFWWWRRKDPTSREETSSRGEGFTIWPRTKFKATK
jgi:hypothetical protein